jgi:hypothetical protein
MMGRSASADGPHATLRRESDDTESSDHLNLISFPGSQASRVPDCPPGC